MNILVVGCGHVGTALIQKLEGAGHDISVVDKHPENLRRLSDNPNYAFGGTALLGDGTDPEVLRRAGVESCDAFVVTGVEDADNLMSAQLAQKIFGKTTVLCRVSDANLAKIYRERYNIETICPTELTACALYSALRGEE